MTADEVAALLRVDARTVNERYAYRKDFPKHIKIGARKLWDRADLMKYISDLKNKCR
ncbi:helix-turn-helix transcriptional regulator [Methylobacillus pratensis]